MIPSAIQTGHQRGVQKRLSGISGTPQVASSRVLVAGLLMGGMIPDRGRAGLRVRLLYICLGYCLVPILLAVTAWRGIREPSYREGLAERLGFGPAAPAGGLWVHAVSVGEVQAAASLVRALRRRYPGLPLTLTMTTPTGRGRARSLFGDEVAIRYLPYDLPGAVGRFLDHVRPALGIILETELWPNLYRACDRRGVPLVLASARVSERSVGRYRWMGGLVRDMLAHDVVVAAQSEADAARFAALGASPGWVHVVGNLKFDFELPPGSEARGVAFRAKLGAGRPVWVAGSTHEGEEELVLDAHERLRAARPDALLVLAPRHPPRFEAVAALLRRRGFAYVARSGGADVAPGTAVLLLDTLGELVLFYAAGDLAFVGGSLVPVGGHNLLEPAALGKPVLTGPYTSSAAPVARLLVEAGAAEVVADGVALAAAVARLLGDGEAARAAGARGLAAVIANKGALGRFLALVDPLVRRRRAT
jgi:3-deoxy-D-manno-octulosonic-acid transferase